MHGKSQCRILFIKGLGGSSRLFSCQSDFILLQYLWREALLSTIPILLSKLMSFVNWVRLVCARLWLNSNSSTPDLLGSFVTMNPWMCDEPDHLELQISVVRVQPVTSPCPLIQSKSPKILCEDYRKPYWVMFEVKLWFGHWYIHHEYQTYDFSCLPAERELHPPPGFFRGQSVADAQHGASMQILHCRLSWQPWQHLL